MRVAGCDLGKGTAKFVVGELAGRVIGKTNGDGRLRIIATEHVVHDGRPMEAFAEWYARARIAGCAALGATGLHADELIAPVMAGLPEDACVRAALEARPALDGPINLVRVGARGYGVITRAADGRVQVLDNEKCSSGTGETMVKIAGRFGLSIEEADRLARGATETIAITARCSVFAKSEMTHFGNQGRPAAALFRGYFRSVATYVAALLSRVRVDGPVALIGGGARLGALVDALADALGVPVLVPDDAQCFEAHGAALLAAEQLAGEQLAAEQLAGEQLAGEQLVDHRSAELPASAAALIAVSAHRFTELPAARGFAHRVTRLTATPVADDAARAPAILGLDLGSTGSKAALVDVATGEMLFDAYDRTRGNPVDATVRLVRAVLGAVTPDVRAVALTGSGREAAATVLRAAFPDQVDRIVVENEIVAHATAAIRCDDQDGADLSVVEIGGQDAKYIRVLGGQIVESDLNKACSAGTGSFLEEQAAFYGVREIETFTALAQEAERPPDLGQMCTVFVAEAAALARNEGYDLPDLFGAFQYAVIHNYIHRVMGQRTFGARVFFQGKPATGASLPWTLAAVTGREVVVPPNPGAMGAWGIGLVTREALGAPALLDGSPFDLPAVLETEVTARTEFQCRDRSCATLCTIEKTTVRVGGARQAVLSGGACPKYEISSARGRKLPRQAPSAFDEREALLVPFAVDDAAPDAVGVPLLGACAGYLPFLVTLLRELGLPVRVLRSDAGALARGEARCYAFDACAPVKTAHGVLDAGVARVFLPKLLSVPDRDGCEGRTCPMEQGLPEMIQASLDAGGRHVQVVRPALSLANGLLSPSLARPLYGAAREMGADPARLPRALSRAAAAQKTYHAALAEIGHRTLVYARVHRLPVVVVCGALHVIHDRATNAGVPRLLRENGVLALPMDCYPVDELTHPMPRLAWADARRALRVAASARARGDVYPLLLTAFGCGPSSFAEQFFAAAMEGYPHTALESDGHGGAAGYVTRVQAFLHTVRRHDRLPSAVPGRLLRTLESQKTRSVRDGGDARYVVFSLSDRLAPILASVYRSYGIDAVPAPRTGPEALALAREDCSGKECLPYQLIWGSFRKHLEDHPPEKPTRLVQVTGQGMCRNCMFSIKDQISLDRLGLGDQVRMRPMGSEDDLGRLFLSRTFAGVAAWDLLAQLVAYHRPLEREPGEAETIYEAACDEVERLLGAPVRGGLFDLLHYARTRRAIGRVLDGAAEAFSALGARAAADPGRRVVLLSGDIYLRLDEFASDGLQRRLNARGLQVLVEPVTALIEYMAHERLAELLGLPTGRVENAIVRMGLAEIRRDLYGRVRALHPWLPAPDAPAVISEALTLLDRHPQGEAPATIGNVLHVWNSGLCDGVVVVSPWGCGPALITESLLRHQREIPTLFVYGDGTPVDTRRLNAFAFRLRRLPPRAPVDRASFAAPR